VEGNRRLAEQAMPRRGRRKARGGRLEDGRIYHEEHEGHGEVKWTVGSGQWTV